MLSRAAAYTESPRARPTWAAEGRRVGFLQGHRPWEVAHALVDSPTPMHYSTTMHVPVTLVRLSGLYFFLKST